MPLTGLIFRLVKQSPLTAKEGDDNLRKIRDFVNSLEQLFGVRLKPDGTLKDDAIDDADIIKDGIITEDKLAEDAKFPAGVAVPYGGAVAPAGWLLCDGAAYVRVAPYDRLFKAIGTAYGVGDNVTTFNVPKMARCVPMGAGGSAISNDPLKGGVGNVLGNVGGEELHLLKALESGVKKHTHTVPWRDNSCGSGSANFTGTMTNATNANINTSEAAEQDATNGHNNIQPSVIFNYIIKY